MVVGVGGMVVVDVVVDVGAGEAEEVVCNEDPTEPCALVRPVEGSIPPITTLAITNNGTRSDVTNNRRPKLPMRPLRPADSGLDIWLSRMSAPLSRRESRQVDHQGARHPIRRPG